MTRQGSTVSFFYREPGSDPWTPLRSFPRPDLPATLQVGLQASAWTGPTGWVSSFDEIRFVNL